MGEPPERPDQPDGDSGRYLDGEQGRERQDRQEDCELEQVKMGEPVKGSVDASAVCRELRVVKFAAHVSPRFDRSIMSGSRTPLYLEFASLARWNWKSIGSPVWTRPSSLTAAHSSAHFASFWWALA